MEVENCKICFKQHFGAIPGLEKWRIWDVPKYRSFCILLTKSEFE